MGGMGGLGDTETMLQMLENPAMQQMLQQVMSNPEMMQQMLRANPQTAAMAENPMMMQALQNPELMRSLTNPESMRAMLNMQQAMQQMQQTGLLGPMAGMVPPQASTGSTTGQQQTPPSNPFAAFGGAANPFASLGGTQTQPGVNLEQQFASQLEQLEAMGFTNKQQNLQALVLSGGNMEGAVDRLLSGDSQL